LTHDIYVFTIFCVASITVGWLWSKIVEEGIDAPAGHFIAKALKVGHILHELMVLLC